MTAKPAQQVEIIEQQSNALTPLDMLNRAVQSGASIEIIERVAALCERWESNENLKRFNEAMGRAQQKMRPVVKDASNPQTRSKYASYGALDNAIRPLYTSEGFSLSFDEGETTKQDCVRVLCYAACAGYMRTYHVDMPADGKGAKGGDVMSKTHATGSAFSYGKRYLLTLIFNLATIDRAEDDGNAAGADPISAEQVQALEAMVTEIGGDRANELRTSTLKYFKAETFADILISEYSRVVAALNKKKAKKS